MKWRKLVCRVVIVILPTSLMTQDYSARGMLHNDGGVWLNRNPAPISSALFLNDLVQTQKDHWAKIDADGSVVIIEPDTIVQFEGDELVLDHGGLQLKTSTRMRVRVNCVSIIPLSQDWNRYDVTDVDGRIVVAAHQNDVKVHYQGVATRVSKQARFSDAIVHQGEQVTREERCGAAAKPADAIDAALATLDRPWAIGVGLGVIGVVACWALCRGDEPASPSR